MIQIETSEFFRIRLKATRTKLTSLLEDLNIIDKDTTIDKIKAIFNQLNTDMELYLKSIKEHENLQEKQKDDRLKAKYLRIKPDTMTKSKLSKYEVSRIKGKIYSLYDLSTKLKDIIDSHEKNNKINLLDELNKFKSYISKEEQNLSQILLKSDLTYQKNKMDEMKQYLLEPE